MIRCSLNEERRKISCFDRKNNVAIISKDGKAHIPLDIPAGNKQSSIHMTMEYPVILPDHIFVVSTKHELIPSVYATRKIKKDGLTYSGPTHAAIWSLKRGKADNPNFGILRTNYLCR